MPGMGSWWRSVRGSMHSNIARYVQKHGPDLTGAQVMPCTIIISSINTRRDASDGPSSVAAFGAMSDDPARPERAFWHRPAPLPSSGLDLKSASREF